MLQKKQLNHIFSGIGLLALLFTFMLIQLYTPYFLDDFGYNFCKELTKDGEYVYTHRISSFEDLWKSFYTHRMTMNGRLSDLLVMTTMFLGGKTGFAIVNSLMMFICCLLLAHRCYSKIGISFVVVSFSIILLILPEERITISWASGACNYLWGFVYYLLFLHFYERAFYSKINLILCLFFALLLSANHECAGAAMVGALTLKYVYKLIKKKQLTAFDVVLFIVCIIGFAITLASPAVWGRIGRNFEDGKVIGALICVVQSFPSIIIPAICLGFAIRKLRIKVFDYFSFYFILSNIVIVVMLITQIKPSACFYLCVGILVFFVDAFREVMNKYKKMICIISLPLLIIILYSYFKENKNATDLLNYSIEKAAETNVVVIDTVNNPDLSKGFFVSVAVPFDYSVRSCAYTLWNTSPFIVVFNSMVSDRSIYRQFDDLSANPQVIRNNDKCYIRLPKGIVPRMQAKVNLTLDGQICGIARPYIYGYSVNYFNEFLDKKIRHLKYVVSMAPDYDGNYHYVILSPAPSEQTAIELPIFKTSHSDIDTITVPLSPETKE